MIARLSTGTRFAASVASVALLVLLISSPLAEAQGAVGIGPRLTFVRGDSDLPDGSQRFAGGAIRLGGGKTALEVAIDFRSTVTGDLTERIKDYPIQASLLVFPIRSLIAPYLLGGVGWYSQRVERLSTTQTVVDGETTRKMGYHAGFGGELRVHRHFGVYGDYRYTFIHFGDDENTRSSSSPVLPSWIPFAERLKMSHQGSMFTWGATVYF
jgi:Outer membrane protein beta-barrel domain